MTTPGQWLQRQQTDLDEREQQRLEYEEQRDLERRFREQLADLLDCTGVNMFTVCRMFNVTVSKVNAWKKGREAPTFSQLQPYLDLVCSETRARGGYVPEDE